MGGQLTGGFPTGERAGCCAERVVVGGGDAMTKVGVDCWFFF